MVRQLQVAREFAQLGFRASGPNAKMAKNSVIYMRFKSTNKCQLNALCGGKEL